MSSTLTSLRDFFLEWRAESNPWRESYREGGGTFETIFLGFVALFVLLNWLGSVLGRKLGRPLGPPLSRRPTVLAASFHSGSTSVIAIYLLLFRGDDDDDKGGRSVVWQRVALPLSLAYFVVDVYWYCLPTNDVLIAFHHFVMCFCHYPVGHDSGAVLAGAGDKEWVVWLSIAGYTSEISTVLMNYRWYLLQTLEEDWIGFAVVNVFVVLSWMARIVLFGYLLTFEIAPRFALYVEKKQLLTYVIMVVGHAVIGLLSCYWVRVMCRGGVRSLITFQKRDDKKQKGDDSEGTPFSFGDDIGRDSKGKEAEKRQVSSPHLVFKKGMEEAEAYVEGTLFDGGEPTTNGADSDVDAGSKKMR